MKEIRTRKPDPCFKRWSRANYGVFASLRRHVTIGVLSVGMSSILSLATGEAQAAEVDTMAYSKVLEIDEVAIVGTKTTPTRSTMSPTVLFDRTAVAAAPLHTLEAALRLAPSIDLRERGAGGVQSDILIRGGSFDQTMILLNGINFTDARTGHQSHSLPIDLDCIAGVELIDGVTGVGAYAGAVNVRTRPAGDRYLRIEGTGGGDGYAYGNLSGGWTAGRLKLFAAGSYRRSDGYRPNTDFDNWNGYARLTYDSEQAGYFDLQGGYQSRDFGSNGFYAAYNPDQYEETRTGLASLRWVKSWGDFTLSASAGYRKNFDRYDWKRGMEAGRNRHNTDNVTSELSADYYSVAGITTLGGDYAYNHIFSTNLGERLDTPHGFYTHAKSRHTGNIWLRHVKSFRRFDVAGSLGLSFTPYGRSLLWSLSGGYKPLPGLRLEAAAAQSMRLPTFTDLYYTSAAQINNLDLVPEKAITWRLGADYASGCWSASLRTYYRDGRNVIDWVWRPNMGNKWHSEQSSRLGTFGVEVAGGYRSATGFLRAVTASYAYITISQRSDIVTKNAMDFLRNKTALGIELQPLKNVSVALTGSVCDRNGVYTFYPQPGTSAGGYERSYEPYFLLDGRVAWTKGIWKIYFDATNLTGADYCDIGGLPMPGRWLGGGLVVTIGK